MILIFLLHFLVVDCMLNEEFISAYINEEDPETYEEATKSTAIVFCNKTINRELVSILSNHTWVLPGLPRGCKLIILIRMLLCPK